MMQQWRETSGDFFLVRHAPPQAKPLAFYGPDVPIIEGCQWAFRQLAQRLPSGPRTVWMASDMQRAVMSAERTMALGEQEPEHKLVSPDFIEQDFGRWTRHRRRHDFFRKAAFGLPLIGASVSPPEGEDFVAFNGRVVPPLREMAFRLNGFNGVLFAHQGVVQSAIGEAEHLSPAQARGIKVPYLSVTHMAYHTSKNGCTTLQLVRGPEGGVTRDGNPLPTRKRDRVRGLLQMVRGLV